MAMVVTVVVARTLGNATIRRKDAEKVPVPKFPLITSLKQSHLQVGKNLISAGGFTDCKEVTWLSEVFLDGADASDERYASLELTMSTALTICIKEAGGNAL